MNKPFNIFITALLAVAGYLVGVFTANGETSIWLAILCFIAALAVGALFYVISRITR